MNSRGSGLVLMAFAMHMSAFDPNRTWARLTLFKQMR
jgi:hypothetical protein